MKFSVITLGCKVNSCESAAIANSLCAGGHQPVADGEVADIYVINSCAVTSMSVKKARQLLSRCKREHPECITVLCGCYPQVYLEDAGTLEADIVVGNTDKGLVAELVATFIEKRIRTVKVSPLNRVFDNNATAADMDRTRAFIKIEDGCDRFCTYCMIPLARGRVRSMSLTDITEQAKLCAESGHREIVLTGINLGCYGQDLGLTLGDAVRAADVEGIERIRLGSLEPDMLTDEEIAKLKQNKKLCGHFHLSLQSGCDETLSRMKRRYNTEYYKGRIQRLRAEFTDCAITTDVMVGFAGETEEEYQQSKTFVEEIGFAKIHVFPYSIRGGTIAASRSDHVMPQIKIARAREMEQVAKQAEKQFLRSQVGTVHTVLIEKARSGEYSHGFTESYIPARIYGASLERHSLVRVEITGSFGDYCTAKII